MPLLFFKKTIDNFRDIVYNEINLAVEKLKKFLTKVNKYVKIIIY